MLLPKRYNWPSLITIIAGTLICLVFFTACQQTAQAPPTTSDSLPPEPSPDTEAITPDEKWVADGLLFPGEYLGEMKYGDYEIRWISDNQYIYIGMRAKTTGFVAVGIQPGRRMKDADIVLGYVEAGEATVNDLFSQGDFGPHPPDTELGGTNNIAQSGGGEEDGFTTIEFKRLLVTGDEYDIPLSPGVNKIIWAYGRDDLSSQTHVARGYGEITLP